MEWLGTLAQSVIKAAIALGSLLVAAVSPAPPAAVQPAPLPVAVQHAAAPATAVRGQLLVRYRAGTSSSSASDIERAHGATKKAEIPALGVRVLSVAEGTEDAVLQELARDPRVAFVERDRAVAASNTTPNDYWWPSQWSQKKTRTDAAWDLTRGTAATVIAILDTGVDLSQPDLQGKLVAGYNVIAPSSPASDDNGHGTWTAGVAGAASNNVIGVSSYCWGCALMPVKVLGADGTGTMSAVASGITWAVDHGARVISMSLSGPAGTTTLQSAVQYAHARGAVLVASAGNYGNSTPTYPAAYPEVLGVAGSDPNDALYSWSNYGSWVELAGPGCSYTTGRDGWYGSFCGTSASAPAVAGIAGLAMSYAPAATNATVEAALESSSVRISAPVAYGRVDAYAALLALGAAAPSATPAPTSSAAPTASPTAAPTAAPTPAPTSSPTPAPLPTTAPGGTLTATFGGAVNNRNPSRSFSVSAGAGSATATLTFSKSAPLSLTVLDVDGNVLASQTGASPVTLTVTLPRGDARLIVSGTAQSSFSLTLTYPSP